MSGKAISTMNVRVGVAVLVFLGLIVLGVILMGIVRQRRAHDQVSCLNNFRELGQFAALYDKNLKEGTKPELKKLAVPAGTIANPALPPDSRLSWIADSLEFLSQRRQPTAELAARLDKTAAWDSDRNRDVSKTALVLFLAPGAAPEQKPGDPAIHGVTQHLAFNHLIWKCLAICSAVASIADMHPNLKAKVKH